MPRGNVAPGDTIIPTTPTAPAVVELRLPMSAFQAAIADADVFRGSEVEDNERLVGIPFAITEITVREGIPQMGADGRRSTNYANLRAIVADQTTLAERVERRKLSIAQAKGVLPDSEIIINDGSTGVYRQIIAWLESQQLVTLPEGPDNGPRGTTRFESDRRLWDNPGAVESLDSDGDPVITWKLTRNLVCLRGLRRSDYESDFNPDGATTFYIA